MKTAIVFSICVLVLLGGSPSRADPYFETGAKSLFIGHSFFVPIAKVFDKIATDSGFAGHSAELVFAGGPRGLPEALWKNAAKKDEIEDILARGDIELFGMTVQPEARGDAVETYRRWIDLALRHNPRVAIFIGHPWIPGGPKLDTARFGDKINDTADANARTVERLRDMYPQTTIYFINYGDVAAQMKTMFEAGTLNDVATLTAGSSRERGGFLQRLRERRNARSETGGTGDAADATPEDRAAMKQALFIDGLTGHAGPMMMQMMAVTWLQFLYGADPDALTLADWDAADAEAILRAAEATNRPFVP